MSLLEEIQLATIDNGTDLGTVLRKCKLLAASLHSQPLEDWLIWESNGYPENVQVPDYRIWPLTVKGNFVGSGWTISRAPIPPALLPENVRDRYDRYQCRMSITAVEEVIKSSPSGVVSVSTADLMLLLSGKVYTNQQCINAWAEFSTSDLVELVNSVRNRVLDFCIALRKKEAEVPATPETERVEIEPRVVTQIFQTTIFGGSANLVGVSDHSVIALTSFNGDLATIERILLSHQVGSEDIEDLKRALTDEPHPQDNKAFGPKVAAWTSRMMGKAADGTWKVGLSVAGNLIAQLLRNYYGLS